MGLAAYEVIRARPKDHILSKILTYITTILKPSASLLGPLDPWGTSRVTTAAAEAEPGLGAGAGENSGSSSSRTNNQNRVFNGVYKGYYLIRAVIRI